MKQTASLAKITAPRLPAVYPRRRLFRLLDQGRRMPVTWISGLAGSGKTTLVKSWIDSRKLPCIWYQMDAGDADLATFFYYLGLATRKAAPRNKRPLPLLTPEYLMDVPTFSRRFFEQLCGRVLSSHSSRLTPHGFIIVLDNYHEVPPESPFHDILRNGMSAVPDGVHVVVASRTGPPPAFAADIANNRLRELGWEELRMTADESARVIRMQGTVIKSSAVIAQMQERAGGWAAGLVLMAKAAKIESIARETPASRPDEKIFDYFASELFDHRTDGPTRDFLVKTAFLPKLTPQAAEQLTGNKEAGQILAELNRRNYFTEKRSHPVLSYQYHALFREFLLHRGEQAFSETERTQLVLAAAKLMHEAGQNEAAADLYRTVKEWNSLVAVIMQHSPMLAMQGRYLLALEWINALPAEIREAEPWLLYWTGVCNTPCGPAAGRPFLEKAFRVFEQRGDMTGAVLAWIGVMRTYIYEYDDFSPLDPWLDWMECCMQVHPEFPSVEIETQVAEVMLGGIMHRRPYTSRIGYWVDRALAASRKVAAPDLKVQLFNPILQGLSWTGELSAAETVLGHLHETLKSRDVSPFSRVLATAYGCIPRTVLPLPQEACLQDLMQVRATMRSLGIAAMDAVIVHLAVLVSFTLGDKDRTVVLLEDLKPMSEMGRNHAAQYHFDHAWYALINGHVAESLDQSGKAVEMISASGTPFPELMCRQVHATALFLAGKQKQAVDEIGRARAAAERFGSKWFQNRIGLLEAEMAFESGDQEAGSAALRKALELGRKQGYMTIAFHWRPAALSRLCARALEQGIETEYVIKMIEKLKLSPPDANAAAKPQLLEAWPWPLKIFTLSGFRVEKDGKPLTGTVRFSRKVPQKPLELLKLLIAQGGGDVSEERIIDALWPDAEGDAGRKSLSVTVARLRDLLDLPNALTVGNGAVSLNERVVWTDERAFEALLRSSEEPHSALRTPNSALERALALYQGPFLEGEPGPWAISRRERLRESFVRAALAAGRSREERGERDEAVEIYRRGLEADELVEQFYAGLMSCHRRQGRPSEALAVYRRCRSVFESCGLPLPERVEAEHSLVRGQGRS